MQRSSNRSGLYGHDEDDGVKQADQEAIDRVVAIDMAREDHKAKNRPPTSDDDAAGIVVQQRPSRFHNTATAAAKPAAGVESRLLRENQKRAATAPAQGVVHNNATPAAVTTPAAADRVQQFEMFIPEVIAPSKSRFTLERGKSQQSDVSDLTTTTGFTIMPPTTTLRPAYSRGGDNSGVLTSPTRRERGLFALLPKDPEQLARLATTMEEKEPTAREVAMSLLFSDEELQEAKTRARPTKWEPWSEEFATKEVITPIPRRRRSVAAVATAAGLPPSQFLDELMSDRRPQRNEPTTSPAQATKIITAAATATAHGVVNDDDELPTAGVESRTKEQGGRIMTPSAWSPIAASAGGGPHDPAPSVTGPTVPSESKTDMNNTNSSSKSAHAARRLSRASAIVQSAARKVQRAHYRRKSTGSDGGMHIAEVMFGDDDDDDDVEKKEKDPKRKTKPSIAAKGGRNRGALLAPALPQRRITGSVLQCNEDVEVVDASLSDIDNSLDDYDDASEQNDTGDETYAMAVARTNLARKLAKEDGTQSRHGMLPHHQQQDSSASASALGSPTCDSSSHDGDVADDDNANDLPQILSRPGAFAINRVRNADSVSHDSFSHNMSMVSDDDLATFDREILRHRHVVEAEVYEEDEECVVDGNLVPLKEEIIDPKTKRRLRIMTMIVLGLIFGAIAMLTGTLVDFTPESDETVGAPASVTGWSLIGKGMFGAAEEPRTLFGSSIRTSQDGTRIVATSPGTDDGTNLNVGKVYVLDYSEDIDRGAIWTETSVLSGHGQSEEPAMSLAASSDARTLAIGYPRLKTERGVVDIITETQPGKWSEVEQFRAEDFDLSDRSWFGHSVDLSSNATVISISSPLHQLDGQALGAVHVLQAAADGKWSRKGEALLGDTPLAFFGWSIDLSGDGDVLAIGAPAADNAKGLVRVFRWDGSTWTKLGQDFVGEIPFNRLGESVSLSYDGTVLAIGSRWLAIEKGLVKLYRYNEGDDKWDEVAVITGDEPGEGFGSSVDLSDSGTTLAIGAPQSSYFGPDSGRVEVRVRNEQSGAWELSGGFIGNASLREFGASVAISEDGYTAASGAPNTDFDAKVIRAGSVQVYERQ